MLVSARALRWRVVRGLSSAKRLEPPAKRPEVRRVEYLENPFTGRQEEVVVTRDRAVVEAWLRAAGATGGARAGARARVWGVDAEWRAYGRTTPVGTVQIAGEGTTLIVQLAPSMPTHEARIQFSISRASLDLARAYAICESIAFLPRG